MVPSLLHPFAKPTRESFIPVVRGAGALLWTADGRELVDGMASLWYCAAGHGRSEIADAVRAQMDDLEAYSCFEPFTTPIAETLADRLCALTPIPDARVFYTCSGSEAIDTAMKLARLSHLLNGHPERQLIITRVRGYHGTNYGGTSAQGIAPNRDGYGELLSGVIQIPSDDVEALANIMKDRGAEVAAVIAEPVQGAGGVYPPVDGYLEGLRKLCDQHGAFLIFDEVITGFGRTGSMFGAQTFGVVPDMTTFAKAVTSGYQPLGGVFLGTKARAGIEANPDFFLRHGFTYSGHASACAAAMANLDIIEGEGLVERAHHVGARLSGGLRSLVKDGNLDHIRGIGAIWGAQMRPDQNAMAIRDHMLTESGVIVRALNDCVVFCPPLVTTDEQIDRIVDAVAKATAG